MSKRFRALELGFVGGKRIREGEEFSADKTFKASWAVEIEVEEKAKPKRAAAKKAEAVADAPDDGEQAADLA